MPDFFWKYRQGLLCGVFFILGLLIYSNTFHVPFHFDDIPHILKDPYIRNAENWPALWSAYPKTRFLSFLSLAFNYSLHGVSVWGYHLFNTVLHILNACLVYILFSLLLSTPKMRGLYSPKVSFYLAAFSALIFLAHPLQTQAVTYIIQRLASLATFFYLGTLIFYLSARLKQNPILYAASILSAVIATMTKEIVFTLPAAVILVECLFFEVSREKARTLARLAPFLLVLLVPPYLFYGNKAWTVLLHEPTPITSYTLPSRWEYFLTQVNVLCTYLRLYFFPVNQNLDYDYPVVRSLMDPKTLICLVALVLIFIFAVVRIKKNRLLSFSIFWFFLTLSVESSIIPIEDVIYEHRMYLPLAGFAAVIPLLLLFFIEKLPQAVVAGTAVVLVFSSMTYARNRAWGSQLSLYEDVVKKSPRKARGYNNLGSMYYYQLNDPVKAKKFYEKAIEVEPGFGPSYFDLGAVYDKAGDTQKALELYQKALELDPSFLDTYNNLAVLYDKRGDLNGAIEILWKGIARSPNFALAYANLGSFYVKKGDLPKAIECLKKGIEVHPYFPLCYYNLGLILRSQGSLTEAASLFRKASDLDPDNPDAIFALGEVYAQEGKTGDARRELEKLQRKGFRDKARELSARLGIA